MRADQRTSSISSGAPVQHRATGADAHGAVEVALAHPCDVGHRLERVHLATGHHGLHAEPADVGAQVEHARAREQVGAEQARLVFLPHPALDRGSDDRVVLEDVEVDAQTRDAHGASGRLHGEGNLVDGRGSNQLRDARETSEPAS